jgi:hypothetical protein
MNKGKPDTDNGHKHNNTQVILGEIKPYLLNSDEVVEADHLSSSPIIELLTDLELMWVVAPSLVAAVA